MLKKLCVTALALLLSQPTLAANEERSLCVFDVVGRNGDTYQMMQNYVLAAQEWGINFTMKPYTEEALVVADFRSGKCDAVELFGMKNRDLLKFPGSLDMMAALPSYDALYTAVAAITAPTAAKYMQENGYETVGIIPGGMAYLYSHDRTNLTDRKSVV